MYSRRYLSPLTPPTVTSQLSATQLEHRATRSWRFLHALADIASARYHKSSYLVLDQEEKFTRPHPEDDTRGIVAVHLAPGGRWLSIMLNCKVNGVSAAMLVIWDLWAGRRVLKRPFLRSVHYAHIRLDESSTGLEVLAGFEKSRSEYAILFWV